tara:strand:- start:1398 stop:1505 length:108 start_codon:yes stop_codon:yes gene_type:complete
VVAEEAVAAEAEAEVVGAESARGRGLTNHPHLRTL